MTRKNIPITATDLINVIKTEDEIGTGFSVCCDAQTFWARQ
jgi:hypothetical protein